MKYLNFFRDDSPLYSLRWFIVFAIAAVGFMAYADLSGWGMFSSQQQQWGASGPGYHK